jgi:nucleoside-diphosphate-sugar epimerase
MKTLLVTGSSGLIGSEVCVHFAQRGWRVVGLDNNQRAVFFGPQRDTRWNQRRLQEQLGNSYQHIELDIRDRQGVLAMMAELKPDAIVHTAAQPSHDRAAAIPFDDFDTNAVGTLNLLEATRQSCPESPFVHLSTNKVYGDRPNSIALKELETRWDYDDPVYANGIAESFSIDQSKHSLFGASKVAAGVMVQEYGRYFDISSCCLRGGCLTGPTLLCLDIIDPEPPGRLLAEPIKQQRPVGLTANTPHLVSPALKLESASVALPPDPQGVPARTGLSASCRQQGPAATRPGTGCSPRTMSLTSP